MKPHILYPICAKPSPRVRCVFVAAASEGLRYFAVATFAIGPLVATEHDKNEK